MSSSITLQQKRVFHTIDRQVYARLITEVGLDLSTAKYIVAFWFWLEREGFRHFVNNMLHSLPPIFTTLASETITCLNVIYSAEFVGINHDTTSTRFLVSQGFFLKGVYERRERAKTVIENFIQEVCNEVFSDISQLYIGGEVKAEEIVPRNAVEELLPCEEECDTSYSCIISDDLRQNMDLGTEHERTLFITFSKGHPISKSQLKTLFTRKYGKCVEAIYMRDPLFARVILKSASSIARILGDNDLVKLHVNGKHAWVRRFTPKQNELQSL